MKLPNITIEYVEEDSYAIGKLSWQFVLAFGIHWAWVYLAMYSCSVLFQTELICPNSIIFISSSAMLSLTLFCYALFNKKLHVFFEKTERRRMSRIAASLASSLGIVLMAVVPLLPMIPFLSYGLIVLSAFLTGFGSAVLLMSLGVSSSVCDTATVAIYVGLSMVVSFILYCAIMLLDSLFSPIGSIICIFLPLLEMLLLNISSGQMVDNLNFSQQTLPVDTGQLARAIIPICIAFGTLLSVLRSHLFSAALSIYATEGSFFANTIFSAAVVCLIVALSVVFIRKRENFLLHSVVPICAICLALLTVPECQTPVISYPIMCIAYLMLGTSIWVVLANICQDYRIKVFLVFGIGRGCMAGAAAIVTALMTLDSSPFAYAMNNLGFLVPCGLICLCLGMALAPQNIDILRALKQYGACPAFDDFEPQIQGDENSKSAAEPDALSVNLGSAVENSAEAQQSAAKAENPDIQTISPVQALKAAPESSRKAEQAAPAFVNEDSSSKSSESKQGRFKRRCAAVADTFLLSRREAEVLFLLAKGYSGTMIQEQLYISEGTVNTHMSHIYRKLSVHSQKDLISLVESFNVD